jgi:hypothetical protein
MGSSPQQCERVGDAQVGQMMQQAGHRRVVTTVAAEEECRRITERALADGRSFVAPVPPTTDRAGES